MYSFKLKIRGAQFYSEKASRDMSWGDYAGNDTELEIVHSFVGLGVSHTITSAIMAMAGERPVSAKDVSSSSERLLGYNMPLYNMLKSSVNKSTETFEQESSGYLPKKSLRNYHGARNRIKSSRAMASIPPARLAKDYASLGIDLPFKEGLVFMAEKIKEAEAKLPELSSIDGLRAKQKLAYKEFGKASPELEAIKNEIDLVYSNAQLMAKERSEADGNGSIRSKIYLLWGLKDTDPENPALKYLEFLTGVGGMSYGSISTNTVCRDFYAKNTDLQEARPDGFSLDWAHNTIEYVNVYSGEMSLLIEDKSEAKALFDMFKSGPGVASFGNGGIIEAQLPKFFDEMEIK